MEAHGPLSLRESVRILARLGETMANAHAKGVLHLDLKPANLMLLPYGQVCVLDWGVARFHDLEAYRAFLSVSGESEVPESAAYEGIAGTPSYMPVEQALGEALGPATDIYAAGTLLYEMLVGRLPHEVRYGSKAMSERSSAAVVPPRAYRADVPERLEALCLRMLAARPADRPASFSEVLAELDELHGVDLGRERTLSPGEVLFREGDRGEEAFQILEGTVAVTVEGPAGPTELARRGVGDLIGEMAVVLDAPRSATVTALERTRVAVVTGEVLSRAMESANPLLARMVRSLSARLREEVERVKGAGPAG
jgi:CRP-like cAMP-binding protein